MSDGERLARKLADAGGSVEARLAKQRSEEQIRADIELYYAHAGPNDVPPREWHYAEKRLAADARPLLTAVERLAGQGRALQTMRDEQRIRADGAEAEAARLLGLVQKLTEERDAMAAELEREKLRRIDVSNTLWTHIGELHADIAEAREALQRVRDTADDYAKLPNLKWSGRVIYADFVAALGVAVTPDTPTIHDDLKRAAGLVRDEPFPYQPNPPMVTPDKPQQEPLHVYAPRERGAVVAPEPEKPTTEQLAAIAACPTPVYHETHRYCPSCPWTESS